MDHLCSGGITCDNEDGLEVVTSPSRHKRKFQDFSMEIVRLPYRYSITGLRYLVYSPEFQVQGGMIGRLAKVTLIQAVLCISSPLAFSLDRKPVRLLFLSGIIISSLYPLVCPWLGEYILSLILAL